MRYEKIISSSLIFTAFYAMIYSGMYYFAQGIGLSAEKNSSFINTLLENSIVLLFSSLICFNIFHNRINRITYLSAFTLYSTYILVQGIVGIPVTYLHSFIKPDLINYVTVGQYIYAELYAGMFLGGIWIVIFSIVKNEETPYND